MPTFDSSESSSNDFSSSTVLDFDFPTLLPPDSVDSSYGFAAAESAGSLDDVGSDKFSFLSDHSFYSILDFYLHLSAARGNRIPVEKVTLKTYFDR